MARHSARSSHPHPEDTITSINSDAARGTTRSDGVDDMSRRFATVITDARLLSKLSKGLPAERFQVYWREFFPRYEPLIRAYVGRVCRNANDVEELSDQIMDQLRGRLVESKKEFTYTPGKRGGMFRGYLRTTVVNAYRRWIEHTTAARSTGDLEEIPAKGAEEAFDAVWAKTLPTLWRDRYMERRKGPHASRNWDIFWAVKMQDRTHTQVAIEWGLSTNNVGAIVSRVWADVREITEEIEEAG